MDSPSAIRSPCNGGAIEPSRSLIRMATRFGSIQASRSPRPRKGRNWSDDTCRLERPVMRIADPYVDELTSEASTTRRVLERVPEAHLNWRPHEKSMSLGQLALHVATLPRQLTEFVTGDALDFSAAGSAPPTVGSHQELLAAFASSTEQAQSYLAALSDERASATWRLMVGSRELFAAPRAADLRSLLFNHWYHHRGQLLVYLRLLNVPVPSVYGPTADQNPFADACSHAAASP